MNKNRIRLTESQLHRVIKESVKRVLTENTEIPLETINEYAMQLLMMFFLIVEINSHLFYALQQKNKTKN